MSKLPTPTGYHMLVKLPKIEEVTKGGIYKPDDLVDKEKVAATVVEVISMGPQCYTGTMPGGVPKFPYGPWSKVGDHVVMKSYAGTRLKVEGENYRLITDDTVQAVVPDPSVVERG